MDSNPGSLNFTVFGAGVVGLTTALAIRQAYPTSNITIVSKHFPGDRDIAYTSPWAGADWSTFSHEEDLDDVVTFRKWEVIMKQHPESGLEKVPVRKLYDIPMEKTRMFNPVTKKIWYEELLGGKRILTKRELPKGAVYGAEFKSTFRINTAIYLSWLQNQVLLNNISLVRRSYTSIAEVLKSNPSTNLLLNCTGLGSYHLTDVRDTNLYPTRGQTVLISEPAVPLKRLYEGAVNQAADEATYVFPRPLGGGIILGGLMQEGNWSPEVDYKAADSIIERCCTMVPELGTPEEVKKRIISHGVGLRPSRKGGVRIELEKWNDGTPVVHNYGHSGAGYQSSWGTAERALELVRRALSFNAKL